MLFIGLPLSFTAGAITTPLMHKPAAKPTHEQNYLAQGADLDRAVSKIRKKTGGRVLSAETKRGNGKDVHVIRILTKDGKVKRHRVDAATGRSSRSGKRRR